MGSSRWSELLTHARTRLIAARDKRTFLEECGRSTAHVDREIAKLRDQVEAYRREVEERT
jgi:hypothetical protein